MSKHKVLFILCYKKTDIYTYTDICFARPGMLIFYIILAKIYFDSYIFQEKDEQNVNKYSLLMSWQKVLLIMK